MRDKDLFFHLLKLIEKQSFAQGFLGKCNKFNKTSKHIYIQIHLCKQIQSIQNITDINLLKDEIKRKRK